LTKLHSQLLSSQNSKVSPKTLNSKYSHLRIIIDFYQHEILHKTVVVYAMNTDKYMGAGC